MNILELHDEPWDSGLAHYALTLAEGLKKRGHRVHFWAAPGSFAAAQARRAGLLTREVRRPWLSLPSLRREVKALGVQLLNAHTGSAHSLAAALAAGTPAAVVRTRGDTRPPAGHALAQALAARTSLFIAANSRIRGEIIGAFPGARVETVFQGLERPLGACPPLPAEPRIGLLGRLDPVKGHSSWLRACAGLRGQFPSARFICAGHGSPERLQELRAQARKLGLGGSVEFLGRVQDALSFIASCRIGVVASTGSEAVSRAALEWMSLGRPVIATTVGCLPDLVDDGETGLLVPPGDAEAMGRMLARLLAAPAMTARLGGQGRVRFERRFDLSGFSARTESLYARALGKTP
jgi:glycosyltransferase involved in cell wall biosynthesis